MLASFETRPIQSNTFQMCMQIKKGIRKGYLKDPVSKSLQIGLSIIFVFVDTTRPFNATQTKAVSGVCVDPHVEHRIASFSEVRLKDVNKTIVNY